MDAAEWRDWQGLGFEFTITANRYLHHMIRLLVGTMVEIGLGRRDADDVERLLEGGTGLRSSPPAPAQGLYLTDVLYPDDVDSDRFEALKLPQPSPQTQRQNDR